MGPQYFPLDPHCPPLGLKFVTMYPYRPPLGLPYALHWPKYTLRAPIDPNICCGHQMTPMGSNIPSVSHQPQIGPQVSLLGPKWSRSQNEFSFFLVEITFEKPKKSEVENIN